MGVVYRAHDERLDRDVAIKVLAKEVAADPGRLARFENEAQAVAKLDHPNILAIHELGTYEGAPFIVTELLEGESLRQRIPSSGMGWQKVIEIGASLADGLAAAHGKGIVHRDLKPENIFITSDGRVKILDFGLAQVKAPLEPEGDTATLTPAGTVPGTVMGTVGYMSPEQLRGELTDARSDIFALGCVLYEMLSGRQPFLRKSAAETTAAILKEDPTPPSAPGVAVPAELERTVRRCLEKSPQARFQSASDLAYNLRAISTASAVPVTASTERAGKSTIARFGWAAAGALLIGVAAVVVMLATGVFDRQVPEVATQQIRSIALLPLENLTGDPEQAFFVDGLHDELIATFVQISALDKVIARTSVMGFRDPDTPIRDIGQQLDVDAVLEGSVRRSEDTVRATFQLIDARTESHLWADSFERNVTNILALQSDVARAVVSKVKLALSPQEEQRLASSRPVNEEAYEANLRGNYVLSTAVSEEGFLKARAFFEEAIEIDPDYAPPYVGLSIALRQLVHRFHGSPTVLMPKARAAALKALELDEGLATAHSTLGNVKYWWEWDWSGAEAEFRRALELNPNDQRVLYQCSLFLSVAGRADEAVELGKRALQLSPLDVRALSGLGLFYHFGRRFDEGIRHLEEVIELNPHDVGSHWYLAWNHVAAERYEEAVAAIERAADIHPSPENDAFFLSTLTWTYSRAGRAAEANEAFQRLLHLSQERYVQATYLAYGYYSIGDIDRAFEYLDAACEAHDTQLVFGVAAPSTDPFRSDPRFQAIIDRMNFPESWR
jgi:serine/threonine-protein kinase